MNKTRAFWGCLAALASTALGGDGFEYAEDELAITLNPLHESAMSETRINELLFEGLWAPGYDGQPEPRLADGYELAPDRLSMTVYLKEGLTWSDGEPIGVDDVLFTVAAYQNPRTASPDRGRLSFIRKAQEAGRSAVRFQFEAPEPEPLEKFYWKVLPAHRFESTAVERSHPFGIEPVTSGPYRVEARDLGTWALVGRRDAARPPAIGSIKVREMPDKNQQVSSLGYGYIQAMITVPFQYLAEIERSRGADLIPYQSKSWWYVGMNEAHPLLRQVGVRNALARVIDVEEALALIGEGDRISGPFVPSSRFYNHQADVAPLTPSTDEAAARLAAAGLVRGAAGWTWQGEAVRLRLFYRSGLGEAGQTVAVNLQAQLRRFGLDAADPIALDKPVWNDRVFDRSDFDLVLDSWSFDKNENIYDLFHRRGTQNFVGYAQTEVDALLDKALAEADPAAKVAYLRGVHRLLHRDQPYVFLWSLRTFTAVRREVRDVYVQPFYYFTQFPKWGLRPPPASQ